MNEPEPTLQSLCARRPRLLRIEAVRGRGGLGGEAFSELALGFDAARLRIWAPHDAAHLGCEVGDDPLSRDPEDAREEEPWWRVMGSPLIGAWITRGKPDLPVELALQLREDASSPRIISLARERTHIRVRWEPKERWEARVQAHRPE